MIRTEKDMFLIAKQMKQRFSESSIAVYYAKTKGNSFFSKCAGLALYKKGTFK